MSIYIEAIGSMTLDAPDDLTWNRYLLGKTLRKWGLGFLSLGLILQFGPVLFSLLNLGK